MIRSADDPASGLDLGAIRSRLKASQGPHYWRSLEELAGTEEFQEYLHREFPQQASEWTDPTSRRQFLRLMGASLALAGISGCVVQPPEEIVPYVRQPEEIVPGNPIFFATAFPLAGYGTGVLVESHMGRPTKIEGNPKHPGSLGATDAMTQAATLSLYDPDRSQSITRNGRASSYDELLATLIDVRGRAAATKGAGLRLLTEATTSPTLLRLIGEFLETYPEARWFRHEPVNRRSSRDAARMVFGEVVEPIRHFDRADVVLSLDEDFLSNGPDRLHSARDFTSRREPENAAGLNRLYVAESMLTITGSMADHRLPVRSTAVAALALEIARRIGVSGLPEAGGPALAHAESWISAVVRDLQGHRGSSLVVVGEDQPAEVHALAHLMNEALGNAGKTIEYIPALDQEVDERAGTIEQLTREMHDGQVDTLIILGGNPAFTAPADVDFAGGLDDVRLSIRLGPYDDETALLCNWQVPEAHFLESWGDIRAFDGTVTVQQPLIAPLYGGRTPIEILSTVLGRPNLPPQQIVRETWTQQRGEEGFDAFWRESLHNGVVAGTAAEPRELRPTGTVDWSNLQIPRAEALELVLRPDPAIYDGRFANNGWLQELPRPMTKLTWDNAALISPATAERLGLADEEVVELTYLGRKLEAPILRVPGHADESVTLYLGFGRRRVGRVGDGVGADAYQLRSSANPWFGPGLELSKTGRTYPLATTQLHFQMEGRGLVQVATIDHFREHPDFAQHHHGEEVEEQKERAAPSAGPGGEAQPETLTLFQKPRSQAIREQGYGNAWGMVINLNTCIGCKACVIACQAENNIPVVGKDQVLRGREMHWLRVDHYFEGDAENPRTYHQPVPCMHCERAPCELVCPVAATTHSPEGLNEMTYNRCVGTRYCSNNCPYKVRRFNFFRYSDMETASLKLMRNPDVTVRTRGIMEKCTYCVQRINRARIFAEVEKERGNRSTAVVQYGEVETACQGACPTRAITFGNLNDREGLVARQKADPRNYALLAELNTQPRTTYLARLTNPNIELEGGETQAHE